MKKRHLASALALVAAASLVLAGCSAGSSDDTKTPGATAEQLVVAVDLAPTGGWDPSGWTWATSAQIMQAAYASLLNGKADGGYEAGLATEWGWESPTEFQMKLREGVTFTDGTPFDAEAVKVNLEHFKASDGRSATLIKNLENIEIVNDHEVVLHWSAPQPDLEMLFTQHIGMMASPKALGTDVLLKEPVGAGPYTLVTDKTVPDSTYTFKKNPDYWDAKNIPFETMVFRIMADGQAAFNALQSGQVDVTWGSVENLDAAKSAGLKVFETPGKTLVMYFVDGTGQEVPAQGDVRVRQALNYAVDRDAIAKNLLPGRPTSQFLTPDTDAYDPKLDDFYKYDPEKAKKLLAEAGYANGLELTVNTYPGLADAVAAMAGYFEKVGVKVNIKTDPFAEFIQASIAGNNPLTVTSLSSAGTAADIQGTILPDGSRNARHNSSDTINKLWAEALQQTGAEQKKTFQKISRASIEEAWMVTVEQLTDYSFYDAKVTGMERPRGHQRPSILFMKPAE